MKLIFQIIWFVVIVLILAFLFLLILWPSHISYISTCMPDIFEEKYSKKYETVGTASINISIIDDEQEIRNLTEEDVEIIILLNEKWVYKHELVHKNQILRGFGPACNKPIQRILFESEAYMSQLLPDFIYDFVYSTDINREIEELQNQSLIG